MKAPKRLPIDGSVSRGFEPVWEAFIENFTRRGELGGACCIYQDGEKVVDLWGGVRDRASGERWREDTMVLVHSTTKGLSAMVMALAHSRGWLDYDARVSTYWPEFAQNGKKGRRENRHHRARRSAAPMPCGWRRVGSSAPAASGLRAAPNCVTTWWSTHYPKVVVRMQPLG